MDIQNAILTLEREISRLQDLYKSAWDDMERTQYNAYIDALQYAIDVMHKGDSAVCIW